MRSGLRCRSELFHAIDTAAHADRLVSAGALALAGAVIEATDKALLENNAAVADQAADGLAHETDGSPIKEKSVGDYVTALDMSLDRHLTRALTAIREMAIISEEGPAAADLHALPEAWLIDPLDGTTASICGETALCGPMVARLEQGEPWMSVMLSLDGTTLAIAERGVGAVVLRSTADGYRWLPAGGFASMGTLKEGCVLFNPQSDSGRSHPAFVKLHDSLRTGAHTMAIESRMPHSMASVALGTKRRLAVIHDNSASHPKQMAWDVLPVKLWVEERGGVYWGVDGQPYDIRQPMPIIAATRADVAERLLALAGL